MELAKDVPFLSCIPVKDTNGSCDQEECITDTSCTLVCEQNNSSAEIILDIGSPSRELDFLLTLDPLQGWINPITGEKNRDGPYVQEAETSEEWQDNCAATIDAEEKTNDKPPNVVQEQFMASKNKNLHNDDFFSNTSTEQVVSCVNGSTAGPSHKLMQSSVLVPLVLHNSLAVSNMTVISKSTQEEKNDTSFLKENFEGILNTTCQDDTSVHRTIMNVHNMGNSFASPVNVSHKSFSVNNFSEERCPEGRDFPGVSLSKYVSVPVIYGETTDVCGGRIHLAGAFSHPNNSAPQLQNGKTCEATGSSFQSHSEDLVSYDSYGESWENARGEPPSPNHLLGSKMQNLNKRKLCLVGEHTEELKRSVNCSLSIVPDKDSTPAENICCLPGNMGTSSGTSELENLGKRQISVPFKVVQYFDKVFITEEAKCDSQEESEIKRLYEIEKKSKESVSRAMSKVTKLASRCGGYNVPVKGNKGVFFCRKKDFTKKTVRQLLMSCSSTENLEKDNMMESSLCEDPYSETHIEMRNMNISLPERSQGSKSLNIASEQEQDVEEEKDGKPEDAIRQPEDRNKFSSGFKKRELHQEESPDDLENLSRQGGYQLLCDDSLLLCPQKNDIKTVPNKTSSLAVESESCHQTDEDLQPLSEESRNQETNGSFVKQGRWSVTAEAMHIVHDNVCTLNTDLAGSVDETKEQPTGTTSAQVLSDQEHWKQGSTGTTEELYMSELDNITVIGQDVLTRFDPPMRVSSSQICALSDTEKAALTSSTYVQTDLNGRLEPNTVGADQLPVVENWKGSYSTITVQSCRKGELNKRSFVLIVHETSDLPKNSSDNPETSSGDVENLIGVQSSQKFWQNPVENTQINQAQTLNKASNTRGYCSIEDQLYPCLTPETAGAVSEEQNCSYSTYFDLEDLHEFQELYFCFQDDAFNNISGTTEPERKRIFAETQDFTPEELNGSLFEECSHRLNTSRDYFGTDDGNLIDVHSGLTNQLVGQQRHSKNNGMTYMPTSFELADTIIQTENEQLRTIQGVFEDQIPDTDNWSKHQSSERTCTEEVPGELVQMDVGEPGSLNHTIKCVQSECVSSIRELYLEQDIKQICKHNLEQQSTTDLLSDAILDLEKKCVIPPVSCSDPLDIWIEESPFPASACTPFFPKSDLHGNFKDEWLEMDYCNKTAEDNPGETTLFSLDYDFLMPDYDEGISKQLGNVLVKRAEQMSCDIHGLHEQPAENVGDCLQDNVAHACVGTQKSVHSLPANSNKRTSLSSASMQLSFSDLQTDFTFLRSLSSSSTTMLSSVSKDTENSDENLGEKIQSCSEGHVEDSATGEIHGSAHNKVRMQSSETPLMDVGLKVESNGSTSCMAGLGNSLKTSFFQHENPSNVGPTSSVSWPLCTQRENDASQDKNGSYVTTMTDALQTSCTCMQTEKGSNGNMCSDPQCVWSSACPAKAVAPLIGVGELCFDMASVPALHSSSTDNNQSHLENPKKTESLVLRHSSNLAADASNTSCFLTSNDSFNPSLIAAVPASSLPPPSQSVLHHAAVSDSQPSSSSPVTSWSSSTFLVMHVPACQYNPPCPCHPPTTVCSGSETGVACSVACVPFHPSMLGYQCMYAHPAVLACPSDQLQTPSLTQSGLYRYDPIARDYHMAGKCSQSTYKQKGRIVTRGGFVPTRHFSIRGLRIGSFVFLSHEDKSANSNKLKLAFSKRTLLYEMKIRRCADSPYELFVVAIHFDSIVGLWGRDKIFLIEVNTVPEMYIKPSSQNSLDGLEPVDITGGNIKSVPYHFVYLSHSNENTVKHYLCKDQHLCKLLVKSVIVDPSRTLCQNQKTGYDSMEKNRILNGKLHSETSDPQGQLRGRCVDAALKHCQRFLFSDGENLSLTTVLQVLCHG